MLKLKLYNLNKIYYRYPDGSTYVGRLYNDIMDGYGKY